jgi:predicted dehydrogenase
MAEDLRVGIIGCGNISTTYLNLGPLFSGFRITTVADLNPEPAKAQAERFGVQHCSVDALLAADDIDLIVNLTIPDAHFFVTRSILEAGKHAYSEKPLVLSLEDGRILSELSASSERRVGCAPDTFLGGAHQAARAALDEGRVGEILSGTAVVMSHGMEQWHPNPDFFFKPGGGPILDLGPYYLANLIHLIGPVDRVVAMGQIGFPKRKIGSGPRKGEQIDVTTPTTLNALLHFASGAQITLLASWDVWSHAHHPMELYGTKGSLFLPDPNFFGGSLSMTDEDGPRIELDHSSHPFSRANEEHGGVGMANYRCAGLADMAQAILENRDHRCSLERTLHGVEVMASILKSAETGQFVDLASSCTRPAALPAEAAHQLLRS